MAASTDPKASPFEAAVDPRIAQMYVRTAIGNAPVERLRSVLVELCKSPDISKRAERLFYRAPPGYITWKNMAYANIELGEDYVHISEEEEEDEEQEDEEEAEEEEQPKEDAAKVGKKPSKRTATRTSKKPPTDPSPPIKRNKRKRPTYDTCQNCGEEFEMGLNRKGDCRYHPGDLEPDYDHEHWDEWDEHYDGSIESESNIEAFPDCFKWTCCEELGSRKSGCRKTFHEGSRKGDSERSKRTQQWVSA